MSEHCPSCGNEAELKPVSVGKVLSLCFDCCVDWLNRQHREFSKALEHLNSYKAREAEQKVYSDPALALKYAKAMKYKL